MWHLMIRKWNDNFMEEKASILCIPRVLTLMEHQSGFTYTHYKLIETVKESVTFLWHIISLFPFFLLGVAVFKEMKNNFLSAKAGFVWTKLSRLVPLGFRGLSREAAQGSISVISQLHFRCQSIVFRLPRFLIFL